MARRAALFHIRPRSGFAHFDARINGIRIREALVGPDGRGIPYSEHPTREQARLAQAAAEELYRDRVAGRLLKPTGRVVTSATLDELVDDWLEAIRTPATAKSVYTKSLYGKQWVTFSDPRRAIWPKGDTRTPLERLVSDSGPEEYALFRLRRVVRKTVRKELSALFGFFAWLETKGHILAVPARKPLPKGNPGVRSGRQRRAPVDVSPDEALAILSALPEWSKASDRKGWSSHAFRVRAVFEFMWETSWRPSTLERIEFGRNWSPGQDTLVLEDGDDKARFGRELALTPRAKEILETIAAECHNVVKAGGPIFGHHDYRKYIKAAAKAALGNTQRAKAFSRYDFRHGRINQMLEATSNMLGTAYQAGHLQLTTTNNYLRAQRRQGDAVVAALGGGPTKAA